MWGRLRRFLFAGLKGALLEGVSELDNLEGPMRKLIQEKGPEAAVAIVDMIQAWLRGLIDRNL